VNWIFTRLCAQYFTDHGTVLPLDVMVMTRVMVRRYVEAHGDHFAEFRRRFFMIDISPENDDRFPIAIEDCLPACPPEVAGGPTGTPTAGPTAADALS
jgi:hypothetical protein